MGFHVPALLLLVLLLVLPAVLFSMLLDLLQALLPDMPPNTLASMLMLSLLVLLVLTVLAWCMLCDKRYKVLKTLCETVFERTYASCSPPPQMKMSYPYGYPAFEVLFRTREEFDAATAAGINAAFLQAITDACRKNGTRNAPFDARKAVFFTYPERDRSG